MDPFLRLVAELHAQSVRFETIGVGGANSYALGGSTMFATRDRACSFHQIQTTFCAPGRRVTPQV